MNIMTKKELADAIVTKMWEGAESPPSATLLKKASERMVNTNTKKVLEDILHGPRETN